MSLVRVEEICLAIPPVAAQTTCTAALSMFQDDSGLFALPVEAEGAIGLVTRRAILEAMVDPQARAINAACPIVDFVVDTPMLVATGTTAGLAARSAAERYPSAMSDGFIVIEDDAYRGLVSPSALLAALADENAGRARTLAAAARRLEEAKSRLAGNARDKADFLAFIGHEIRTPLTGILGVADLLYDRVSGGEPRRLARTISDSGQQLERLLSDLLDLSRIEAGRMPISAAPFDLREFANDARDTWQPRGEAKRLDLRVRVSTNTPRLHADPLRLRQVLFNLMSNALKFTERGQVTVDLSTFDEAGGLWLRMRVADTGSGISDADKARLFEAFEQANAGTLHRHGGSGLGLAIARSLVNAMGGQITLTDNPGGGAVFTVELPVAKAGPRLVAAVPEKIQRPASGSIELGRILLAEDHAATALVISEALRAAGWKVDHVATAEDALTRAMATRYQAVLSDIHLPGQSGDVIVRNLRSGNGLNAATPVIAVTADLSEARRTACRALGFTALIEKPIRPRALVATLADILMAGTTGEAWAWAG
ncbi:MAG TPA: ATP-binding protein [Hyphomonas sp.]|nr:response regulator [Hyphomonas sp.]MCA8903461.1 response regulator [Hyphomonas sp.]MCB9962598.1 response regulator [Hyphomonas sp.]HPE47374.1 ATP-binding protein [Hyphomonas sp.]